MDAKDITPADLQLVRELIADDSGEMLIGYFEVVDLLAKLVEGRDHWRLPTPIDLDELASVTGDQIRWWLTRRGWDPVPGETGRSGDLGNSQMWRLFRGDARVVTVFDKDTREGASRSIGGMAYHHSMTEREVLDELAAINP